MLIDERSAHIDVAEQNPVHRIVQKAVQAFHRRQRGYLRHAKARAVVGEANILADLLPSSSSAWRIKLKFAWVA